MDQTSLCLSLNKSIGSKLAVSVKTDELWGALSLMQDGMLRLVGRSSSHGTSCSQSGFNCISTHEKQV